MGRSPLLAALCLIAAARIAAAEPQSGNRTLLLLAASRGDLDPEALADAIRLQVLDRGLVVEVVEGTPASSVGERLEQAVARMDERGAPMALFYDREPGEEEVVLYVARRRGSRALVTVFRLPGEPGPSLYRSFALKVRDLVGDWEGLDRSERTRRAEERRAARERSLSARRWALGADWTVSVPPALEGVQHGPSIHGLAAVGRRYEAHLDVGFLLPRESSPSSGVARLTSVPIRVGARWVLRESRLTFGAGPVVGAVVHVASGEGDDGRAGSVLRAVPTLGWDFGVRFRVWPWLEVEAAGAVELALVRQRFSLGGEPAFDLGRTAGAGRLGAVFPFEGGPF